MALDLGVLPVDFTSLGLPPKNTTNRQCAGLFGTAPCTYADFLEDFKERAAVYAPETNAVYSNIGYSILGAVVEAATGMSFDSYVRKSIYTPLALNGTTTHDPPVPESRGVIPNASLYWGAHLGFEDP